MVKSKVRKVRKLRMASGRRAADDKTKHLKEWKLDCVNDSNRLNMERAIKKKTIEESITIIKCCSNNLQDFEDTSKVKKEFHFFLMVFLILV